MLTGAYCTTYIQIQAYPQKLTATSMPLRAFLQKFVDYNENGSECSNKFKSSDW
jgi:hypothetical protein